MEDDSSCFDKPGVFYRLGNDEALLKELVVMFFNDLGNHYSAIELAIQKNDSRGLAFAAHALKGAVSNIGGVGSAELAKMLESAGRSNQLGGVPELFLRLKTELMAFENCLKENGYR